MNKRLYKTPDMEIVHFCNHLPVAALLDPDPESDSRVKEEYEDLDMSGTNG